MKRTRRLRPEIQRECLPGDPRPRRKIRVLLADELTLVRDGLRLLINSQPDMEVVAEASDEAQALERFKAVNPDVAVLDVSVPPLTSVRIARGLLEHCPGIKLVVVAGRMEAEGFPKQVRAKISGCVAKDSSAEEFLRAIRKAASDGVYFESGGMSTVLRRHLADASHNGRKAVRSLTAREETVVRLVAMGHTNKEIAAKLSLSSKTVEAHKFRIGKKLGNSRVQMVRYAMQRGWLAEDAVVTPPA